MKFKSLLVLLSVGYFLFSVGVATAADAAAKDSPVAFIPGSSYSFQPVPDGTKVIHDFIIQNKGTAPLKIHRVKTG